MPRYVMFFLQFYIGLEVTAVTYPRLGFIRGTTTITVYKYVNYRPINVNTDEHDVCPPNMRQQTLIKTCGS